MLDIGREGLRLSDSRPYVHDMLLAMALAEVRKKISNTWQFVLAPLPSHVFLSKGVFLVCNCEDWF